MTDWKFLVQFPDFAITISVSTMTLTYDILPHTIFCLDKNSNSFPDFTYITNYKPRKNIEHYLNKL